MTGDGEDEEGRRKGWKREREESELGSEREGLEETNIVRLETDMGFCGFSLTGALKWIGFECFYGFFFVGVLGLRTI